MKLYKVPHGTLLEREAQHFLLPGEWDALINRTDLYDHLTEVVQKQKPLETTALKDLLEKILAPIGHQEVWAAGVTYLRSREARMEESQKSGGADFYDMVYEAERPELFFKSLPHRVSGPGQPLHIRRDSKWNVPEPELTLFINSAGTIQGYTIGNDMSSRSIEGENPLYLPQAKVYDRSAGLGPCLYVPGHPIAPQTRIVMDIVRKGNPVYTDSVSISRMKRAHQELVDFLYRETSFPFGCFLMTGTCLVPPSEFTLQPEDRVDIHIDAIGTLSNTVAYGKEY